MQHNSVRGVDFNGYEAWAIVHFNLCQREWMRLISEDLSVKELDITLAGQEDLARE